MERCELTNSDISRYSRQLIIPEFGPEAQLKLLQSRVLIVGCGGLGCPASVYLAAAGVGHLTLVDDDVVELNNLHRQIMHSEVTIGQPKVESLASRLRSINSHIEIITKKTHLSSSNACELIDNHDVVLDCTDNLATRYLLNDACAACGYDLPLVSGSALKLEGQLTVYLSRRVRAMSSSASLELLEGAGEQVTRDNGDASEAKRRQLNGDDNPVPCFRCLHPIPAPANSVQGCSDAGVIGVVPGLIGTMQAAEVIKLITGVGESMAGRLFILDMSRNIMRSVELRKARPDCKTCSPLTRITPEIVKATDYPQFCEAPAHDAPRQPNLTMGDSRITVQELKSMRDSNSPHLLIDIRPAVEIRMCHLTNCLYIPLNELYRESNLQLVSDTIRANCSQTDSPEPYPVVLLCHRGNKSHAASSQFAKVLTTILSRSSFQSTSDLEMLSYEPFKVVVRDVAGGLQAWSDQIDPNFPPY